MPRVNVEPSALTDPRFERLARRIGGNRYEALGRCIHVWSISYEREDRDLPVEDVDIAAGHEGFASAMVSADLAVDLGDGRVRIRGTEGRIEWVSAQRERSREGGRRNREAWERRRAERERAEALPSSVAQWEAVGHAHGLPTRDARGIAAYQCSLTLAPDPVLAPDRNTSSGAPPDGASGASRKDADLSIRAREEAQEFLEWFNPTFSRRFQLRDELVADVRKLLAKGFTQRDMRKVAAFKQSCWRGRPEMEQHLVPATLLRPSRFGGYLDEARSLMFRDEDDPHRGGANGVTTR